VEQTEIQTSFHRNKTYRLYLDNETLTLEDWIQSHHCTLKPCWLNGLQQTVQVHKSSSWEKRHPKCLVEVALKTSWRIKWGQIGQGEHQFSAKRKKSVFCELFI